MEYVTQQYYINISLRKLLIVAQVSKSVGKLREYYLVPGAIKVNLTQNQFICKPIQSVNHSTSSNG